MRNSKITTHIGQEHNQAQENLRAAQQRIAFAATSVLLVLFSGTFGYYFIGNGEWSWLDCFYMTVITLTTVGYGETLPIRKDPEAMVFTLVLLIMGMGVMLYFVSSLTAFIIDGQLRDFIRSKRMNRKIANLKDHHIVCGLHGPGEFVIEELLASDAPMVLIERKPEYVKRLHRKFGSEVYHVIGDATDDAVLIKAGIKHCVGIIITLGSDRDNLFCTITARTLNPTMRIITQGEDPRSEEKYKRAGADRVLFTNVIGGQRMASEVLRPHVLTFLDLMIRDQSHPLRIEEIFINENSTIRDKSLRQADLRRDTNALVIAVFNPVTGQHTYNPPPDFMVRDKHILLVLGTQDEIRHLRLQVGCGTQ